MIFHCAHTTHARVSIDTHPTLLYPVVYWWTFQLLPQLGDCKWCCNKHGGHRQPSNHSTSSLFFIFFFLFVSAVEHRLLHECWVYIKLNQVCLFRAHDGCGYHLKLCLSSPWPSHSLTATLLLTPVHAFHPTSKSSTLAPVLWIYGSGSAFCSLNFKIP